jgi:hypothetical protein
MMLLYQLNCSSSKFIDKKSKQNNNKISFVNSSAVQIQNNRAKWSCRKDAKLFIPNIYFAALNEKHASYLFFPFAYASELGSMNWRGQKT